MQLGGLVELASGVDALYLSGRAVVPDSLWEDLVVGRKQARQIECPIRFDLAGVECELAQHGFHRYPICLKHPNGQIGITNSKALPTIRIQPRAEFLHEIGPRDVVRWFDDLLTQVVGPVRWSVNRVDLHADFQGWDLSDEDKPRFITKATKRDTHEDGNRLTGFEFGKRKTGTISARIYDKVIEMAQSGALYWPEIWGPSFNRELPVWRVEFEIGREGLREFGLDSPGEVLDAVGALWVSCTTSWLRFCSPTADETKSRWPVAPEWETVQRASVSEMAVGRERIAAGRSRESIDLILPALVGYLAKFGALSDSENLGGVFVRLPDLVHVYCDGTGKPFNDRIEKKRREIGLPT